MLKKKPPLLLLPGVLTNSKMFHCPPGNGLGDHLSEFFELHHVDFPLQDNLNEKWCFDFHLKHELGKVWADVCNKTGKKPQVLGYSMGGMMALTAQALGIIDAPTIFIVASPFKFFEMPLYPTITRFYVRTGIPITPSKLFGRLLTVFFSLMSPPQSQKHINLLRTYVKESVISVPLATIEQTSMWLQSRKFLSRDGHTHYLEYLPQVTTDCCFIAGKEDRIAPKEAVKAGYDAISSNIKKFVMSGGTHISLASGNHSKKVVEIINDFNREHYS